jgi:hypothetical protein
MVGKEGQTLINQLCGPILFKLSDDDIRDGIEYLAAEIETLRKDGLLEKEQTADRRE